MAVNSHAPRADVGHILSTAMGRPAANALAPYHQCIGRVFDRRCERGSLWLLPEGHYCATHLPHELLPLVTARRDLWIALSGDVWRQVLAEYPIEHPVDVRLGDNDPPPSRPQGAKHNSRVTHGWPPTFIMCSCGAEFEHRHDARPAWWDHCDSAQEATEQ